MGNHTRGGDHAYSRLSTIHGHTTDWIWWCMQVYMCMRGELMWICLV